MYSRQIVNSCWACHSISVCVCVREREEREISRERMCVNRTEQEEEVMICIQGSQPSTCTVWCQYKGMILCSSSHDVHVLACYIHVAGSLHEDPTFSIHSLTHTGSSCLLRYYDCVMPCAGARALEACALILSCLRAHHIQHLLYYCAFILVNPNICVWGGTAKGHRANRRSWR